MRGRNAFGSLLLLAALAASASCDFSLWDAPCFDPAPDYRMNSWCEGNVLVQEQYRPGRNGAKCDLSTERINCRECLGNGSTCDRLCTTDSDCPGGYCPRGDAGGGPRVCGTPLGVGDRCIPGGVPCEDWLSCGLCVYLPPLDGSAEQPDAPPAESAAGREAFVDAHGDVVDAHADAGEAGSPARTDFPCAAVRPDPGVYFVCVSKY